MQVVMSIKMTNIKKDGRKLLRLQCLVEFQYLGLLMPIPFLLSILRVDRKSQGSYKADNVHCLRLNSQFKGFWVAKKVTASKNRSQWARWPSGLSCFKSTLHCMLYLMEKNVN